MQGSCVQRWHSMRRQQKAHAEEEACRAIGEDSLAEVPPAIGTGALGPVYGRTGMPLRNVDPSTRKSVNH